MAPRAGMVARCSVAITGYWRRRGTPSGQWPPLAIAASTAAFHAVVRGLWAGVLWRWLGIVDD